MQKEDYIEKQLMIMRANIRKIRKQKKLSVCELEKLSECSIRTIHNAENKADYCCSLITILKLAHGLNVNICDFFDGNSLCG